MRIKQTARLIKEHWLAEENLTDNEQIEEIERVADKLRKINYRLAWELDDIVDELKEELEIDRYTERQLDAYMEREII